MVLLFSLPILFLTSTIEVYLVFSITRSIILSSGFEEKEKALRFFLSNEVLRVFLIFLFLMTEITFFCWGVILIKLGVPPFHKIFSTMWEDNLPALATFLGPIKIIPYTLTFSILQEQSFFFYVILSIISLKTYLLRGSKQETLFITSRRGFLLYSWSGEAGVVKTLLLLHFIRFCILIRRGDLDVLTLIFTLGLPLTSAFNLKTILLSTVIRRSALALFIIADFGLSTFKISKTLVNFVLTKEGIRGSDKMLVFVILLGFTLISLLRRYGLKFKKQLVVNKKAEARAF